MITESVVLPHRLRIVLFTTGFAAVIVAAGATVHPNASVHVDSSASSFKTLAPATTNARVEPTPKIAFAKPAVVAEPCAKRETFPCLG